MIQHLSHIELKRKVRSRCMVVISELPVDAISFEQERNKWSCSKAQE